MAEKTCSTCKIKKDINEFSIRGDTKKRRSDCKLCISIRKKKWRIKNKKLLSKKRKVYHKENKDMLNEKSRKYYTENKKILLCKQKRYYDDNKKEVLATNKKYREKNKEIIRKLAQKYRQENKEMLAEKKRDYYQKNKEIINSKNKEYRLQHLEEERQRRKIYAPIANKRNVERLKTDIMYKLNSNIHRDIWTALKKSKNFKKWNDLVGYNCDELKNHIERLFTDGMTWEKYLSGEIHIDHNIPKCIYKFTSYNDKQFKQCWGLKNLQPLWAHDNLVKNARIPKDFYKESLKTKHLLV